MDHSEIVSRCLVQIEGQKKILQVFNISKLKFYNLENTIEYNEYVLTNIKNFGMIFPSSFVPTITYTNENNWYLFQDEYEITLDKYLIKKSVNEQEALTIFSQILESVYSLYIQNFVHRNLRPEHFALYEGKWKLRNLVWSNENYGIQNEFTFNPQFQAPEEYQAESEADLDLCQILVWNIGSILFDMICGVHFLNSEKIINKFKNKKFTLEAVGCHKTFSEELQNILGDMLHFNPEKRMSLETIFENFYFSKSVTEHFKQHKPKENSLKKSAQQREIAVEKMLKESALRNSIRSSKALDIFTSKQFLKIDEDLTKTQLLLSRKQQNQEKEPQEIMEDEDFFDKLNLVTKLQKKQEYALEKSQLNIENNPEIKSILGIYKTMTDRCLLLFISAEKISEIPFKDLFREEFVLLAKFSVYYASLIELNRMIRMINLNKNIFQVEEDVFEKFINTSLFFAFKEEINELFVYKQSILEELAQKLENLSSVERNFMKQPIIFQYVKEKNAKEKIFDDIKVPYRLILKKAYDIISLLYNSTSNQQYCRLSLYTVFCMTIDKLYIQEDLEDNFSLFFQWCTSMSTRSLLVESDKFVSIPINQFQKYLDTAPIKTLIDHSKKILKKYFKVQ